MIDIKDLIPVDSNKLYRYEEVLADGTPTGNYKYFKYSPDTLVLPPTPINRATLMALQGFHPNNTVFNPDGSITQTNGDGDVYLVEFSIDGTQITETFTSGTSSITKRTTFNIDGSITEELI